MRNFLATCYFFFSIFTVHAQDLPEINVDELFFGFRSKTPEQIKFVNGLEDKRVWNYEKGLITNHPDTITDPEAIKFVSIPYNSDSDLGEVFEELKFLPNLEYVEIKTATEFRKEDVKKVLKLPRELGGIRYIRYLQLSGTYDLDLEELFEWLKLFEDLEYLGLGHQLESIELPTNFVELQNLKGIKLQGFKGWIFPPNLEEMANLNAVVIFTEGYENLGTELDKLTDLPNLSALQLNYFYPEKGELAYLKELNGLERLEFSNAKFSLQELLDNLSPDNKISRLKLANFSGEGSPTEYSKLKNLNHFEISLNDSDFEPLDGFFDLKKLRFLKIHSASNMTSISKRLGDLENLEELDLSYNALETLPSTIGNLRKLKVLEVRNNKLINFPDEITFLHDLERISADRNQLEGLPDQIGNLQNLEILNLEENRLKVLPSSITELNKLEVLDLENNDLKELPRDMGDLKNLISLPLTMNFLKELPASFSSLVKIRELELTNNMLKSLPADIGKLKDLQVIRVGNNKNPGITIYKEGKGFVHDTTRLPRGLNSIKKLPLSLAELENLKRLSFSNLGEINENVFWEVLFKLRSAKFQVDLQNCGISYLPQTGWKDFKVEKLYLGGNVIAEIPRTIINAPYLEALSFKRSVNDGLSYSFSNREELLAFFEEEGFLPFESLPRTEEMAKAFLNNSYRKKYTGNSEGALSLMEKAFLLDSAYTAENIRKDDYATALLENKRYHKAIEFFTRAIQKDTAQRVRILNFIIPQFRKRAEAYLAVGDSLAALKDLEIVSSKFSSGDWGEAALLAGRINKDSLRDRYFKKGEEFYKQRIQAAKEREQADPGMQLSLLELYIISEDFSKARKYYEVLEKEDFTRPEYLRLRDYLKEVLEILEHGEPITEMTILKREMKETQIRGWSFDLFRQWLKQTEMEPRKRDQILILTNLLDWDLN